MPTEIIFKETKRERINIKLDVQILAWQIKKVNSNMFLLGFTGKL